MNKTSRTNNNGERVLYVNVFPAAGAPPLFPGLPDPPLFPMFPSLPDPPLFPSLPDPPLFPSFPYPPLFPDTPPRGMCFVFVYLFFLFLFQVFGILSGFCREDRLPRCYSYGIIVFSFRFSGFCRDSVGRTVCRDATVMALSFGKTEKFDKCSPCLMAPPLNMLDCLKVYRSSTCADNCFALDAAVQQASYIAPQDRLIVR